MRNLFAPAVSANGVRRLLQFLGALAILAALALLTVPWWLEFALKPMAKAQGATWARYERLGYARFRLHDVRWERGPVRITADRIDAATPALWLLRPSQRQASAGHWTVEVVPRVTPAAPTSGRVRGMPALFHRLQAIASGLNRWLTSARLESGEVRWPGQVLRFGPAVWQDRTLAVQGFGWRNWEGNVVARWPASGPIDVEVTVPHDDAVLKLKWVDGTISGGGTFWAQPVRVAADFPAERWTPDAGEVLGANWDLPAERLKLGRGYATVRGGGRIAWTKDHFEAALQMNGMPRSSDRSPPPWQANVAATADTKQLTLTALDVTTPFATSKLTAPAVLDFARGFQAGNARLTLDADLSRQTWFSARGKVHGTVDLSGAGTQDFSLTLTDARVGDVGLARVAVQGLLTWPVLTLRELEIRPDEVSRFALTGSVDLLRREITGGAVTARLENGALAGVLPAGLHWQSAEASARFSGPIDRLQHEGQLALVQFASGLLRPADATIHWRGQGRDLPAVDVTAVCPKARLQARATLEDSVWRIDEATFTPAGGQPWKLARPVAIANKPQWRIEGLRLERAADFVAVDLGAGSERPLHLAAAGFPSTVLRDWLELPGPDWTIDALELAGKLKTGTLTFDTRLAGRIALQSTPAQVRLVAHGGAEGLKLEELSTTLGDRVVTRATGRIPVAIVPGASGGVRIDDRAPLEVDARTEPDSPLWSMLSDFTGVALEAPAAEARLRGTLDQPEGNLSIRASRLAATKGALQKRLPEITALTLVARANRSGVFVDTLAARVDGQELHANGRVPVGRDEWKSLFEDPADFLQRQAEGHVEIDDADLARLARRVPDLLAEQGRLSARVDLAAGGMFSGELHLRGAALRPIEPLGVIQEINADLALQNRQLEIKTWSARVGGEPVEVRGTIELPADGEPRVALELGGKNLPLIRRTGLVVRSDVALKAQTDPKGATQVSGSVTLRDSFVLADLATLRPSGPSASAASRKPPYFSVAREPFNAWSLALDVRGPRAIRIRTPVFTGVASARFRLAGTLAEPRAVGELTIDEGRVLFPFATFTVSLGAIRLSEADPFHPQLNVNAQSRYRDYLLRLEATGPVDSPHVLLSSNPPLEAADLLLMVTSGQAPDSESIAANGTQRLARLGTFLGQGLILGSGTEENRIELTSGEHVSQQGRETYEFTYRLNEKWALVGEYDEFDEYNAGIKWRAYVQEGDPNAKKK